jgi:transposase
LARDEPPATAGDDAEHPKRRYQFVVHPDAAGIDIGNESHYVAVPPSRNSQPVRRFGCTTAELTAMADWLEQCGIRTVAMQSTGVYWIAVYDVLEQAGLEVYLVNTRETKNLPGRKTDVEDRL